MSADAGSADAGRGSTGGGAGGGNGDESSEIEKLQLEIRQLGERMEELMHQRDLKLIALGSLKGSVPASEGT